VNFNLKTFKKGHVKFQLFAGSTIFAFERQFLYLKTFSWSALFISWVSHLCACGNYKPLSCGCTEVTEILYQYVLPGVNLQVKYMVLFKQSWFSPHFFLYLQENRKQWFIEMCAWTSQSSSLDVGCLLFRSLSRWSHTVWITLRSGLWGGFIATDFQSCVIWHSSAFSPCFPSLRMASWQPPFHGDHFWW